MRTRPSLLALVLLMAASPQALADVCDTTSVNPTNPSSTPLAVDPGRVAVGREAVVSLSAEDVQAGTLTFAAVPADPAAPPPVVRDLGPSGVQWTIRPRSAGQIAVRATWIQTVTAGTIDPVACPRSAEAVLDVVAGTRATVVTRGTPPGKAGFGGAGVGVRFDPGRHVELAAPTAATIIVHYEIGGRSPTRSSPSIRWTSGVVDARETPSRGPRGIRFVRKAFFVVGDARDVSVTSTPDQRDARVWIEVLRDGRVAVSLRARFTHRTALLRARGKGHPAPATFVAPDTGPCPGLGRCTPWPRRIP